MNAVTILSPGPSLNQFDPERDLLPGPVVAINTAMAVYPQADVWLVHSTMAALVNRLEEYGQTWDLLAPGEVWAPSCWDWEEKNKPYLADRRFAGWPMGQDVFGASILRWETKAHWSSVPALCAAGMAIFKGVEHVRLIGLDMKGTGYGGLDGGPLDWRADEDADTRKKWRGQRTMVAQAQKECPAHGITLEVYDCSAAVAAKKKEPARA